MSACTPKLYTDAYGAVSSNAYGWTDLLRCGRVYDHAETLFFIFFILSYLCVAGSVVVWAKGKVS